MSLSIGRLRRIDAVAWQFRCDAGFHNLRPALASAGCGIRNPGDCLFGHLLPNNIHEHMVRHQVLVRTEHAGLLLKSGNNLLS
ncbi:MAG: hypothetical protein CAF44_002500 [Nitrospira sp. CG24D]|nr:MAG: hypothetical protein CAF44_002500 [Nitrospira sp. CG24D]